MVDNDSARRQKRPSPEAMLAKARREAEAVKHGHLKVFLGAAPGVGKTYAMLSAAQQAKADGTDVVVGLVETHGRTETEALLTGLEVLPRKSMAQGSLSLLEFDIDGALARHPELILVDELAHTNAASARHPKRYLDVEELVDAGIDVWTTLNIQHLESLADVVSRIAGITIRERVPDTILEKAHEVVLVDITPDDLIQRLKEGKVYLPDNARRAIDNFFKPSNLTALRELALRRTAEQVDEEMVSFLREDEIEGPWPTSERILVCIGKNERSEIVVRAASRLARGLNASLVAVYLERLGAEVTDPVKLKRIDDLLRLARRLGAEAARITAQDLPAELLRYARRENITQIVIGRSGAPWLEQIRGRSLSDQVVRQAKDIAVHLITEGAPQIKSSLRLPSLKRPIAVYLSAAAAVAAAVAAGKLIEVWVKLPNLSMLFLTAVLYCALTQGTLTAIFAAVLSFLAYNFFFIPPIYTFTIAEPQELFALGIFLIVAVLTGGFAGQVRDQAQAIRKRSATTQRLYEFSRTLSGAAKFDDLLWAIASRLAAAVDGTALVLMRDGPDLVIKASWPPEDELGPAELAAARWALEHRESAGRQTTTLPNAKFQFRPLITAGGFVGVIGLQPKESMDRLTTEDERLLAALLDQAAIAIERAHLAEESAHALAMVESERLRSALLSSISHDLRTPLSSITGAVTSLRTLGGGMSEADKADLLAAIEEEAARLTRFVTNLLDMTRLEGGALDLKRDWVEIGEAVRAAVASARRSFPRREIQLRVSPSLPLVRGDAKLIEQVVFNLLDNADKYSDTSMPTSVSADVEGADVVVAVTDRGIGIPRAELERVFEKFYRVARGDGRPAGTGLGLSICRGVVTAMGGTIRAESPVSAGRGTRMVILLPAAQPHPLDASEASVERDHARP
jgi:two-component system sensor histidine kinase KdpD